MTRTRRIAAAVSLPVAAAFATLVFVGQPAAGAEPAPERPGLLAPLLPGDTAAAEPDEAPAVDPYEPSDRGGRGNPGYGPSIAPHGISPNAVPPSVSADGVPPPVGPNAVPPVGPNAVPEEQLPVTGVPLMGFLGAGILLAAGGATMLYVARRRRLI